MNIEEEGGEEESHAVMLSIKSDVHGGDTAHLVDRNGKYVFRTGQWKVKEQLLYKTALRECGENAFDGTMIANTVQTR